MPLGRNDFAAANVILMRSAGIAAKQMHAPPELAVVEVVDNLLVRMCLSLHRMQGSLGRAPQVVRKPGRPPGALQWPHHGRCPSPCVLFATSSSANNTLRRLGAIVKPFERDSLKTLRVREITESIQR